MAAAVGQPLDSATFGPGAASVLPAARGNFSLISFLEFPCGPMESTVRLSENGRGGRSCRIRAAGAYFWKACADDVPALLPPPSGWLAKIRIFFPLPVHAGLDELPCID